MDEIRYALVVGAGAIGSAVAAAIHRALPGAARLLADSRRAAALERDGLFVNGERVDLPLSPAGRPPESGNEPGLILVCVKNHQLASAISDMAPYVGAGTVVLSLMNGIDSEKDLAEAFGPERVLNAMILAIDAVREGNATTYTVGGNIHFGEARNAPGAWSERVARVADFFGRTGIRYTVPEDMVHALWFKLMVNVGLNPTTAVMRATYSSFQEFPEARRVMLAAMSELIAISKVLGTGLSEADVAVWDRTLADLSPAGKSSMLQDVEARRKTEVELFAGTVVRLGSETGVPTPINSLLFDMVRAIERGYGF